MVGSIDRNVIVALTWLTVATCIFLWTAIGMIGARRLSRRGVPASDATLLQECERARRVLGLRRPIDIRFSNAVSIPIVAGLFHPCVLLPLDAMTWTPERLRVVLLHELAHVGRLDCLWMLATRTVTAILWFHPLVWVLSSHARREAERACDEVVLATGVRGSDYAAHLVDIARLAAGRNRIADSALALAMPSSLEQRIVSILSTRIRRRGSSVRARAAGACGAIAVFAVIATARPTAVVSAQMTPAKSPLLVEAPCNVIDPGTPAPVEATYNFAVASSNDFEYAESNEFNFDEQQPKYYLAEDEDDGNHSGREWYSRGTDLYNNHRYARAAEAYMNAAKRGYKTGTAYYNAGCSYALDDQTDPAIKALRASLDEGFDRPDLFAADEDLNSLRADKRFKDLMTEVMKSDSAELSRRAATKDFDRLAKTSDVEHGDWNSVGMELLRSGDYPKAADAFDREFKVSKDEDALYNMACARSLEGKNAEALKLLEKSIMTGTVDSDHMSEDPDLVALHKDPRFDQLVDLADDLSLHGGGWRNGNVWIWKGNDEKHWRKTLPHFEKVTRDHPEIGRAWFNLGYAQLAADDAAKSTPSFQRALDLGYKPETTMYNLACSSAQSGDVDGAIAWLERSEKAGMEMWQYAHGDDDLAPLRSDKRFKEMKKRWRAEAKKHHHDDDKDWEWDEDDDDDDEDEDT